MKLSLLAMLMVVCPYSLLAQSAAKKPSAPAHPNGPATQEIQTEKIGAPPTTHVITAASSNPPGVLGPTEVKALSHKIWLVQYRLNDLLSQVHPEKWKMLEVTRQSFGQSLDALHKAVASEEDWRTQFEARPDSLYLGFQTYLAIGAVLPRVDGLAHSVSQYENASFGSQFSQASNQLHDLQQLIVPHLTYLLKNQDNYLLVAQTNLAGCQNELNYAEHDKEGHAIPMKNIPPEFKGGHKRTAHAAAQGSGAKKSESKGMGAHKPAVKSTRPAQSK